MSNVLVLRNLALLSHERNFLGLKVHNPPQRRRQRLLRQLAQRIVQTPDCLDVADYEEIEFAVHPHVNELVLACTIVTRVTERIEPGGDERVHEVAHFVVRSAHVDGEVERPRIRHSDEVVSDHPIVARERVLGVECVKPQPANEVDVLSSRSIKSSETQLQEINVSEAVICVYVVHLPSCSFCRAIPAAGRAGRT